MMLYDGSPQCEVTLAIFWFLGFTLVLCWSIYSLPDGGGQATWVPDVFRRQTCLMPLCPIVFIIPSIFWPVTLFLQAARTVEAFLSDMAHRHANTDTDAKGNLIPAMTQIHPKAESYALLHGSGANDEESCIGGVDGGIPMDNLSDDSPRSSMDSGDVGGPLPYRPSGALSPSAVMGSLGDSGSWGRKHFRPMPFHQPNKSSSASNLKSMFGLRKVS